MPGVVERASKRGGEIPPDASFRVAVVEFVDDRRRRGLIRDEACKLAGVSVSSCTRWRKTLKVHGVRALAARSSRPKGNRVAWKQREVAERVEELRRCLPLGDEKPVRLLKREGLTVSASTVGRVLAILIARRWVQACGHQCCASTQRPRQRNARTLSISVKVNAPSARAHDSARHPARGQPASAYSTTSSSTTTTAPIRGSTCGPHRVRSHLEPPDGPQALNSYSTLTHSWPEARLRNAGSGLWAGGMGTGG